MAKILKIFHLKSFHKNNFIKRIVVEQVSIFARFCKYGLQRAERLLRDMSGEVQRSRAFCPHMHLAPSFAKTKCAKKLPEVTNENPAYAQK